MKAKIIVTIEVNPEGTHPEEFFESVEAFREYIMSNEESARRFYEQRLAEAGADKRKSKPRRNFGRIELSGGVWDFESLEVEEAA